MKTFTITLIFLFGGIVAFGQTSEETALMSTLNNFLEGGTNGNVDQFKSAFLSDAVQRSVGSNGQVIGMSVANLAAKIKPGEKMDRQARVVSWSYSGNAATATTETVYATSKIIDYLNLIKIASEWKITTRVYSRIGNEENITSSISGASASKAKAPAAKTATKKGKVILDNNW